VILAGMIGGVVSWIGALLDSAQLESKRWFLALVVLGILSVGFLAMIAWVVARTGRPAGPDRAPRGGPIPTPASPA
jgi:cytochrome bd-type quinol oxidase subunit 1